MKKSYTNIVNILRETLREGEHIALSAYQLAVLLINNHKDDLHADGLPTVSGGKDSGLKPEESLSWHIASHFESGETAREFISIQGLKITFENENGVLTPVSDNGYLTLFKYRGA